MLAANFKGQDKDARRHNMQAALDALAEAVLLPGKGDEVFGEYLKVDRLLYNYSFNNTCLIAMQRPASRRVAALSRFNKIAKGQGHEAVKWGHEKSPKTVSPMKGTQAVWVLAPRPWEKKEKDADGNEVVTGSGMAYWAAEVWAVEDLAFRDTGKPCSEDPDFLPDFVPNHGEGTVTYYANLRTWAEDQGITVEEGFTGGPAGISYGGRILERIGDPVGKKFAVLLHEVAHESLHKKDEGATLPKRVKEAEAEAVAMCVCEALGFAQAEHSAAYLRNHGATKAEVLSSMKRTFDLATVLLSVVEGEEEEAEAETEREAVVVNG